MLGVGRKPRYGFAPAAPSPRRVSAFRPPATAKSPIERVDVNEGFASAFDMDKGTASLFGTLGQLPSRIMESPVALADTTSQRAFGFSPVKAIGAIPGVGQAAGFLGDVVERSGNLMPALINQRDAAVWKAVFDLPGTTPITDELVKKRLGIDVDSPLLSFDEGIGGGLFGIGNRPKTVQEFRAELEKRGFFFDPKSGEPLDPSAVGQSLRGGQSTTDFGSALINDNAMVDMAGRLSLDPLNFLYFVPGAGLAKLGATAARVFPAARAVRAGAITARAARPVAAAEAIARGNTAGATLRGMARFLRGYRTFSVATAAGNFATNRLTGLVNDLTGDDIGLLREIEEFTAAVENNRPMSNNAAFMLLSAATFPYGDTVLRPAQRATRAARHRALGGADADAFAREWGSMAKAEEAFGGPDGLRDAIDFIDANIAADVAGIPPGYQNAMSSTPAMAVRRRSELQRLGHVVNDMRSKGEITDQMRLARFKEWYDEQAGVIVRDEFGKVTERRGSNPWSAPRAARRWRSFRDGPRAQIKSMLDETGETVWGLRDDVVFTHQIDDIENLARYSAKSNNGTVPLDTVLDLLNDHPNVNALDHTGYWSRFFKPGAQAPTLRSVLDKLARQRKTAVKADDYFAEFATRERAVPPDVNVPGGPGSVNPRARIEELRAALNETTDANGTIRPDRTQEAQALQKELETLLAEQSGVAWANQAQRDRRAGRDPQVRRKAVKEASESAPVAGPPMSVHPLLWKHQPDAVLRQVHAIDRELALANPSYRVKALSPNTFLRDIPDNLTVPLRYRNAVGEALFQSGPFSVAGKFIHALTRPIGRDELRRGSRQQLMDELLPLGWRPGQVDALIKRMDGELDRWTFGKQMKVRMFRDPGSLLPSVVNSFAEEVLLASRNQKHARGVLARTQKEGGAYRLLSRSSSRYFRSIKGKADKGDKAAAALLGLYNGWNRTSASTAQRVLAKTVYPMVRFMFDPRWLLLNAVEGGILGATKYGARRSYTAEAQASGAARFFNRRLDPEAAASMSADIGQTLQNEGLQMVALKSFDLEAVRQIEREIRDLELAGNTVAAARKQRELGDLTEAQMKTVLDEFGESDAALRAARDSMRREGEAAQRSAQSRRDKGEIGEATFRAEMESSQRLLDASNKSLAEHLNDKFYRFEKEGPDKVLTDDTKSLLTDQEAQAIGPLLDRVHEINRAVWKDVNETLHGNPSRSTIERLMNSYWFFWPLSYQIKATKWLGDIMLNGSFGHDNGALLAGRYALWQEQHNERMMNNPAYAAMYEANPTLWFAAQMVLPMNPEELGVTMSRMTRLLGAQGQEWLNEWFKSDVGVFTAEPMFGRPDESLRYLTELGPIYTVELLGRMWREANESGFFDEAATPPGRSQTTGTPPVPALQMAIPTGG